MNDAPVTRQEPLATDLETGSGSTQGRKRWRANPFQRFHLGEAQDNSWKDVDALEAKDLQRYDSRTALICVNSTIAPTDLAHAEIARRSIRYRLFE